eukprot:snap_masked-scaffold_21-processed-gene-5.85-mRNA-1 protein AED:1.00 eAED:1.00 QI:0/-1/0/0/-1/1/1/0/375
MNSYNLGFHAYSLSLSYSNPSSPLSPQNVAVGSFSEQYTNQITVLVLNPDNSVNFLTTFLHPYSPTQISFPPTENSSILGSTADYLRIWSCEPNQAQSNLLCLLNRSNPDPMYKDCCAPLTSFDWCNFNQNMILTSSVDSTLSLWDIEKQSILHVFNQKVDPNFSTSRLLSSETLNLAVNYGVNADPRYQPPPAKPEETFLGKTNQSAALDVCSSPHHSTIFCVASEDGTISTLDVRAKYENKQWKVSNQSILRVFWSPFDDYLVSCVVDNSPTVSLLDLRNQQLSNINLASPPGVGTLGNHEGIVNTASFSPFSRGIICTGGEDFMVHYWNLLGDCTIPVFSSTARSYVENMVWGPTANQVLITSGNFLQILNT